MTRQVKFTCLADFERQASIILPIAGEDDEMLQKNIDVALAALIGNDETTYSVTTPEGGKLQGKAWIYEILSSGEVFKAEVGPPNVPETGFIGSAQTISNDKSSSPTEAQVIQERPKVVIDTHAKNASRIAIAVASLAESFKVMNESAAQYHVNAQPNWIANELTRTYGRHPELATDTAKELLTIAQAFSDKDDEDAVITKLSALLQDGKTDNPAIADAFTALIESVRPPDSFIASELSPPALFRQRDVLYAEGINYKTGTVAPEDLWWQHATLLAEIQFKDALTAFNQARATSAARPLAGLA